MLKKYRFNYEVEVITDGFVDDVLEVFEESLKEARIEVLGGSIDMVDEEFVKGEFWDISVRELVEDYLLMIKCLEEGGEKVMSVNEYMDEFEHQDGPIHPRTKDRFLMIVDLIGKEIGGRV